MVGTRMFLSMFSRGRAAVKIAAAGGAMVLLCGTAASAAVAQSAAHGSRADSSSTFVEGTDSQQITIGGSAPYHEPVIGGDYGGYIGMTGNWDNREGCHHPFNDWSADNSSEANADYADHIGIGTGVYWFMGGPGVDPHYNGTTTEASDWGAQQAEWTLEDVAKLHVTYPVVFEDVELPEISPAPDNGWDSVYTSPCSGVVKQDFVPTDVDRAEFNGFAQYITAHSKYDVGVYSAPSVWSTIFGTGSESAIPNTYEWTYVDGTSSLKRVPDEWCLSGTSSCAEFFGGQNSNSKYALMWQWSGGGGLFNGVGDFDQIDVSRTP
jgi:hypothetical protein